MKWREEDMKQRRIDNLHLMLGQKDRLVDLRSRNLKGISNLSALLAGFTIVMFVELQVPTDCPDALVVAYGACSAVVCCALCLTMVQTTLVLASVSNRSTIFQTKQAFHKFWVNRCEEKWKRTFRLFSYTIPLFLIDIALVGWVKFYHTPIAAGAILAVVVIAIVVWLFDQCFWGAYLATSVEFDNKSNHSGILKSEDATQAFVEEHPPTDEVKNTNFGAV